MRGAVVKRFSDQLYSNLRRRVRPQLINLAKNKFQIAKKILLSEIRSHPVSIEIKNHGFLSNKCSPSIWRNFNYLKLAFTVDFKINWMFTNAIFTINRHSNQTFYLIEMNYEIYFKFSDPYLWCFYFFDSSLEKIENETQWHYL